MVENKSDVNLKGGISNDGDTPLHIACENENISSKVLKKLGITPTAPNTSTAPKTTTPKTK